jgi:hypothetical protein
MSFPSCGRLEGSVFCSSPTLKQRNPLRIYILPVTGSVSYLLHWKYALNPSFQRFQGGGVPKTLSDSHCGNPTMQPLHRVDRPYPAATGVAARFGISSPIRRICAPTERSFSSIRS